MYEVVYRDRAARPGEPANFNGTGYDVRDTATGEVVQTFAFRADALAYAARHRPTHVKVTTALRNEQAAYYRLCDEARALGIPTSLDDPRTPRTVADLQAAIDGAK